MEPQTDDGSEDYRQLSDSQEKLLAILPIPSAILSIFGSVVILVMAFKSRRKTHWTSYHALLTGISLTEIIFSVTLVAGNFLYPRETSNRIWAFGNEATCDTIGFFNQFSYSSMLYMTMLSFYFVLTTRYKFNDDEIATKYETKWHIICLGWPLLTPYAALYLDFYGEREVNIGCWIRRDIPKNCGPDGTGERCRGPGMNAIFGTLPVIICLGILVVNNVRIWKYVRKQAEAHNQRLTSARNGGGERNVIIAESHQALERFIETQKQHQERLQMQRSQAFYFVGSFFCGNIITYMLRGLEVWEESSVAVSELPHRMFPLLVVQAVLYPLQGFANMVVWLRPAYTHLRTNFPSESKLWCFRQAIFADHVESMGRNAKPGLLKEEEKKEKKRMERRITALSSNISDGGESSTDTLSPPGSKPQEKSSRIVDSVDEKRTRDQGALMVMMDGSIQSMSTSDDEWYSHE